MKSLHINFNYYNSSLYEHLSNHLIANGLNLKVYYPTRKFVELNNTPKFLDEDPILNKNDKFFFNKRHKNVLNHIEQKYNFKEIDILHAHSLFSNGNLAYSIKAKYDIPYVVAVRSTDINLHFKKLLHMRNKGIKILKKADRIIFLSPSYKEYLINKYVPTSLKEDFKRKSVVIPNGIDSFWFENINHTKRNSNKNKLKILSVGHINKRKNALLTAKAIQLFRERTGIDVELTLVGKVKDDDYFNKILRYDFVKHFSYQAKEDLKEIYRESDIMIIPSITETFGLVYAEAMSQGLPIIYSKGQGFDRQFDEGTVGYSVNSNNSNEIVDKMQLILKDYHYISNNCVSLIEKFSWDRISKEYIKIYKNILSSNKIN